MNKIGRYFLIGIISIVFVCGLAGITASQVGCKRTDEVSSGKMKSDEEKKKKTVGEKIDDTGHKIKEGTKKATEKVGEGVEHTGEKIEKVGK